MGKISYVAMRSFLERKITEKLKEIEGRPISWEAVPKIQIGNFDVVINETGSRHSVNLTIDGRLTITQVVRHSL